MMKLNEFDIARTLRVFAAVAIVVVYTGVAFVAGSYMERRAVSLVYAASNNVMLKADERFNQEFSKRQEKNTKLLEEIRDHLKACR